MPRRQEEENGIAADWNWYHVGEEVNWGNNPDGDYVLESHISRENRRRVEADWNWYHVGAR